MSYLQFHVFYDSGETIIRSYMVFLPKGGSRFFLEGGGPNNLGGSGACPSGKILEILIANGAFFINLDQLRAEISPIFSQYFS